MSQRGRHEFTIDKRTTPIVGGTTGRMSAQDNQQTLRVYGVYSRKSIWDGGP